MDHFCKNARFSICNLPYHPPPHQPKPSTLRRKPLFSQNRNLLKKFGKPGLFLFNGRENAYSSLKGQVGKPEAAYPNWNGITILSRNARTILIVPIIAELLNVSLLKTINPIIKTITSKTDRALKYQHPYIKHILNNTAKISAESTNAGLLFPFAYQQTKANNGDKAVNPTQIIA